MDASNVESPNDPFRTFGPIKNCLLLADQEVTMQPVREIARSYHVSHSTILLASWRERYPKMEDKPTKEEVYEFTTAFEAAFREALIAAKRNVRANIFSLPYHYDFPMKHHGRKMPYFSAMLHNSPLDYTRVFHANALSGYDFPHDKFPNVAKLVAWVNGNEKFCSYFSFDNPDNMPEVKPQMFPDYLYSLLVKSVDRYMHCFPHTEFDLEKFCTIMWPINNAIRPPKLVLSLVVPIAITEFEFDHVRLTPDCFIYRMRDPLQLARSRVTFHGSGAHPSVKDAATHAFVWRNWELPNADSYYMTTLSLTNIANYPLAEIDKFFAALRIVTGYETGYAQILFFPDHWTFDYYVNLPPVYGTTIRRYPSAFDNYGWTRRNIAAVTRDQAIVTGQIFERIRSSNENKIALAIRRLNNCMQRDDAEDSLLDATIGLEILLSDDEPQAISYKLALRGAGLAKLDPRKRRQPADVFRGIKKVYGQRSTVVHGRSGRQSRKRIDHDRSAEGTEATEYLRYILELLLHNPEYLNTDKLDQKLLLNWRCDAELT